MNWTFTGSTCCSPALYLQGMANQDQGSPLSEGPRGRFAMPCLSSRGSPMTGLTSRVCDLERGPSRARVA